MFSNGRNLFTDKAGATAIEYGLLAAFIAVAIIVSITSLGQSVSGTMSTVDKGIDLNKK